MRQNPFRLRLLLGLGLAVPVGLILAPPAQAAWNAGGSRSAGAQADTMPSGGQPTASATGNSVTVKWPTALFPDDQGVAGYVLHRFDAASGAQATVTSSCSGTVTAATCTEQNVPTGTWTYTDTPVQDNWSGGASPASAGVSVP
jgi:hypothetical protein